MGIDTCAMRLGALASPSRNVRVRRFGVDGEMKSQATAAEPHAALAARLRVFRTDTSAAVGTQRDGMPPADLAPIISGALHLQDSARLHSSASQQAYMHARQPAPMIV